VSEAALFLALSGAALLAFLYHRERRRRRTTESVARQRAQEAQVLLETLPALLLRGDSSGRIRELAGSALAELGLTGEEFPGQPLAALLGERAEGALTQAQAEGAVSVELQLEGRTLQGWLLAETSGFLLVAADRTELMDLEARLRREEEASLRLRRDGLTGRVALRLAHDIRNQLTAILGYAGLAAGREENRDGPVRQDLEEIQLAASRVATLTRLLLEFGGLSGEQENRLELGAFLEEVTPLLRSLCGAAVEVVVLPAEEPLPLAAPRAVLREVLLELVWNAREAMPEGGKLVLEAREWLCDEPDAVGLPAAGPYALLAVSDTGEGIPPSIRERIFEPFFGTRGGTGLGLSRALDQVRGAGGALWAYSEPGFGSTFKVFLPLAGRKAAPARAKSAAESSGLDGSETLLVVEDDILIRRYLKTTLEARGYTTLLATHGDDALEQLGRLERPPDLVLTDIVMPRLGGHQLLQEIRRLLPEVPVLLMSGYTEQAAVLHGLREAGAAGFLQKPFRTVELLRAVRLQLDRERMARGT